MRHNYPPPLPKFTWTNGQDIKVRVFHGHAETEGMIECLASAIQSMERIHDESSHGSNIDDQCPALSPVNDCRAAWERRVGKVQLTLMSFLIKSGSSLSRPTRLPCPMPTLLTRMVTGCSSILATIDWMLASEVSDASEQTISTDCFGNWVPRAACTSFNFSAFLPTMITLKAFANNSYDKTDWLNDILGRIPNQFHPSLP